MYFLFFHLGILQWGPRISLQKKRANELTNIPHIWASSFTIPSGWDDSARESDDDDREDPGPDAEHHECHDISVCSTAARAEAEDAAKEEETPAPNSVRRILKIYVG